MDSSVWQAPGPNPAAGTAPVPARKAASAAGVGCSNSSVGERARSVGEQPADGDRGHRVQSEVPEAALRLHSVGQVQPLHGRAVVAVALHGETQRRGEVDINRFLARLQGEQWSVHEVRPISGDVLLGLLVRLLGNGLWKADQVLAVSQGAHLVFVENGLDLTVGTADVGLWRATSQAKGQ